MAIARIVVPFEIVVILFNSYNVITQSQAMVIKRPKLTLTRKHFYVTILIYLFRNMTDKCMHVRSDVLFMVAFTFSPKA